MVVIKNKRELTLWMFCKVAVWINNVEDNTLVFYLILLIIIIGLFSKQVFICLQWYNGSTWEECANHVRRGGNESTKEFDPKT